MHGRTDRQAQSEVGKLHRMDAGGGAARCSLQMLPDLPLPGAQRGKPRQRTGAEAGEEGSAGSPGFLL